MPETNSREASTPSWKSISTIANPPVVKAKVALMNTTSLRQRRSVVLGSAVVLFIALLAAACVAKADGPTNAGPKTADSPSSGFSYQNDKIPAKPLSIHTVKVERNRPDLVLATSLAKGSVLDLCPLSEQIKSMTTTNLRPVVGINGDFYRLEREPFAGDPLGFQVMDGELVSSSLTNKPCFWIDAQSQPHIGIVQSRFTATLANGKQIPFEINEERVRGTARLYTPRLGTNTQTLGGKELILEKVADSEWLPVKPGQRYKARIREVRENGNSYLRPDILILSIDRELASSLPAFRVGDLLELSTATVPDTRGCPVAIGGGPSLVRNGAVAAFKASNDRHPRSAFGWNDTHWFFVEVDGRQTGLSIGMTLQELAEYLRGLGVQEGINLDGGGSATLWFQGQVVNSPCYGYERSTANGLLILKKDAPRREPD